MKHNKRANQQVKAPLEKDNSYSGYIFWFFAFIFQLIATIIKKFNRQDNTPQEDTRSIDELLQWINPKKQDKTSVKIRKTIVQKKENLPIDEHIIEPPIQVIIKPLKQNQQPPVLLPSIKKIRKHKKKTASNDSFDIEIIPTPFKSNFFPKKEKITAQRDPTLTEIPPEILEQVVHEESIPALRQVFSYFRDTHPVNMNMFLLDLCTNSEYESLREACLALDYLSKPQPLPHNFIESLQNNFKKLANKYHRTSTNINYNPAERQLLNFYRTIVNESNTIDKILLDNALENFRNFLYQKELIKYTVVYHIEQTDNLKKATENWQENYKDGFTSFSVSRFDTFFYPIENMQTSLLKPGTVISILVIPSFYFKGKEYLNKTDYDRRYESLETVYRSKLKQTYIGNCNYFVDPKLRILTCQIGGESMFNDTRHPGLDIALPDFLKAHITTPNNTNTQTNNVENEVFRL